MKKKRLITNMIAIGLVVVAFIGIFLAMWATGYEPEIGEVFRDSFGIFSDKSNMEFGVLGTIGEIALLVALVLGCLYVIGYVLALCGIGKKWNKVLKLIAILELVVALVGIATGILFAILTTQNVLNSGSDIPVIGGIVSGVIEGYYWTLDVGFYMLGLGTLLSGIVGVFANRK